MKRQYTRRTAKPAKAAPKRPGITVDPATLKPKMSRPALPPLSPTILKTLADAIDLILS